MSQALLRDLRGTRSQVAFSRRLKYKSNVAYLWESGRRWPTAVVTLAAAERVGRPVRKHLRRFLNTEPSWLHDDAPMAELVPRVLQHLKGKTPIQTLAQRTGLSRFAISRWLKGVGEPRLPEFLQLIEGMSLRMLDFVAGFFNPSHYDATRSAWETLQHGRKHFFEHPQSQLVLLALDLEDYAKLKRHSDEWLAQQLALPVADIAAGLQILSQSGQIRWTGTHWTFGNALTIDMQSHPQAVRQLKAWWGQASLQAFEREATGVYSYNLCTVSEADFEKLQELQRATFRAMRHYL